MRFITNHILAIVAAISLGGAVLVEANPAAAEGADQQNMKTSGQQTTKQQSEYFSSWSESEKPGQDYADYAVNGLMLIDSSLSGITDDIKQQPVGGGPDQGQQQNDKSMQSIDQSRQKIKDLAKKIDKNSNITDNPRQFHQAATSTVDALSSLQQARFPKLEKNIKSVRKSVDKLDDTKPLAAQSRHVKKFFKESSDVVSKMSAELDKKATGGGPTDQQDQQKQDQQQDQSGDRSMDHDSQKDSMDDDQMNK